MAKAGNKFLLILDIDKVLAADELGAHAAIISSRTDSLTGNVLPE
jgi:hypothetical protein